MINNRKNESISVAWKRVDLKEVEENRWWFYTVEGFRDIRAIL